MSSRTTRAYREGNLGRIPANQRWRRVFFRSDDNRLPLRDFLFYTIESFQCHWNEEMFKTAASIQERRRKKFLSTTVSSSACLATSLCEIIFNRVKNDLLIAALTPIFDVRWIWSNIKFDPSKKTNRDLKVKKRNFQKYNLEDKGDILIRNRWNKKHNYGATINLIYTWKRWCMIQNRLYFFSTQTRDVKQRENFSRRESDIDVFLKFFLSPVYRPLHSFVQFTVPVWKKNHVLLVWIEMSLDQTQMVEPSSAVTISQHSRFRYFFVTFSSFFSLSSSFFFLLFCY